MSAESEANACRNAQIRPLLERHPPSPDGEMPTCDECGKSKDHGWTLYCVACAERAIAPAVPIAESDAVQHAVIAGAVYDLMGWMTSRDERLTLSSSDLSTTAADAIKQWANLRGLSLDDARVHDWQSLATPTAPNAESNAPHVDIEQLLADCVPGGNWCDPQAVADAIRAWDGWHSLKETTQ